ncbi:MAG: sigma factor-like helix-turn-helix DNA-binding protein [Synechococcales bacterium]|nr:sigma factor-like helix-turn-helix DNA-binding protein [Synechococcales bacterium]
MPQESPAHLPFASLPFAGMELNPRSELVQAALAELSDQQRRVLELAYYEGLNPCEIASRLALPLGIVKRLARQGLLTLRQALQNRVV